MSPVVVGVLLMRCVPPRDEPRGVTAPDIAAALGVSTRNVQRNLVTLERAGLVVRDSQSRNPPPRWWRR